MNRIMTLCATLVLACIMGVQVFAQSGYEVKGVVVDQLGPVIGATVLEKGKDYELDLEGKELNHEKEVALLKILVDFPKEIAQCALNRAPYKMTNYIQKLATAIHEFYTECRVIDETNLDVTSSRLALCKAAKIVMSNALTTIGVSAPTKM